MNKLPIFILLLLLCVACSPNYPVLVPEAKVLKKMGNEVMFVFNEHEGKRTGYQWFRVDNPDEYKLDSTYYLSPKVIKEASE
ncbi:hypothetical protein [uncultured Cyclobacterium sp.]|uniref:hypothetical protein n=1 Tax=uncultured Cyclobacterium sp. TaxID=453820 RepID=UPI0030EF6523|tara:strand:- start:538 stop:783 length:246 start_codon:yes stop_codon:yes gene_type:complete